MHPDVQECIALRSASCKSNQENALGKLQPRSNSTHPSQSGALCAWLSYDKLECRQKCVQQINDTCQKPEFTSSPRQGLLKKVAGANPAVLLALWQLQAVFLLCTPQSLNAGHAYTAVHRAQRACWGSLNLLLATAGPGHFLLLSCSSKDAAHIHNSEIRLLLWLSLTHC